MSRLLVNVPSRWTSRHPRLMLGAVVVLVGLSQWLVDFATNALVSP